jgi:phosphopantothenate synthetase
LKKEGEEKAIIESKRNEIKDTIAFLTEKRAELVKALQETDNNEQLADALKLIEGELHKFEKQLQESYSEKKN